MWRVWVEVLRFVWITCLGFALFYSSAQAATRTDIDHAIVQLGKTVPNMKLEVELTKTWSRAYVSDRIEGALLTMDPDFLNRLTPDGVLFVIMSTPMCTWSIRKNWALKPWNWLASLHPTWLLMRLNATRPPWKNCMQ